MSDNGSDPGGKNRSFHKGKHSKKGSSKSQYYSPSSSDDSKINSGKSEDSSRYPKSPQPYIRKQKSINSINSKNAFQNTDYHNPEQPQGKIYTIEEIRALQPKGDIPNEYKLKSNGFIYFLQLNLSEPSTPKSNRNIRYQGMANLQEHSEDRFVPTSVKKIVGQYDDSSFEAKKSGIIIRLNRITPKNIDTIAAEIYSISIPLDLKVELIQSRVIINCDNFLANVQIKVLAELASHLSANQEYKETFQKYAFQKYQDLISKTSTLTVYLEAIIVWISYLFRFQIIDRQKYFGILWSLIETNEKRQTSFVAVEVLRTGLSIIGDYAFSNKYYEISTFYRYISDRIPNTGYIKFLVIDLLKLNKSGWIKKQSNQLFTQIDHNKPSIISGQVDDSTILQELEIRFLNWQNNQNLTFPKLNARFNQVCKVIAKVLLSHTKDTLKISEFLAIQIQSEKPTDVEIGDSLRDCIYVFGELLDPDRLDLWSLIAALFANLYLIKFISLQKIIQLYKESQTPPEVKKPPLEKFILYLGNVSFLPADDCLKILDFLTSTSQCNMQIAAAFSNIVDFDDIRSKSVKRIPSTEIFLDGLDIRETIYNAFVDQDDNLDVQTALEPSLNMLQQLDLKNPGLVVLVGLNTLKECDLSYKLSKKASNFIKEHFTQPEQ